MERPELDDILRSIETTRSSLTLLLGEPGGGKSALLARLGALLQERAIALLAIKADFLPSNVLTLSDLSTYLQFPVTVDRAFPLLAAQGPVVLLVDQLDALADMVVQHAERLKPLLELIETLAEIDTVHIVASCRTFEHRHDPRLRSLAAEPLQLSLPGWESVASTLRHWGIEAGAWSASIREELRSPHVLALFLDLLKDRHEAHVLSCYQAMLDTLWQQRVLHDTTGARRQLLFDMAEQMAERETLWLPLAMYEDRRETVHALARDGILTTDDAGLRVGFRHQTLFEFVRARSFLEESGRLTNAVVARQTSLRVRPQLWHALGYLRAADRSTYLGEIELLWHADLRAHLRALVIEFLGRMHDPEQREAHLLLASFDDPWHRRRILSAVVGSPGWFRLLMPGHLPMLMSGTAEEASQALPVLQAALVFARDDVLELADSHWMAHMERDVVIWRLLEEVPQWDNAVVDRFCRVLGRTEIAAWAVNALASKVSAALPNEAPRLVAAWLHRQLRSIATNASATTSNRDADPTETAAGDISQMDPHAGYRKLVGEQRLHDLPAVAEAAPWSFLNAVWPWFLTVLQQAAEEPHPFVIGYRDDHGLVTDWENDADLEREHPLLKALEIAVDGVAAREPRAFLEFVETHRRHDLLMLLVQRLLARGMLQLVDAWPNEVLEFLTEDPRRFALEPSANEHADSQRLIRAVVPRLDASGRRRLEEALIRWSHYTRHPEDEPDVRLRRLRWSREHRLRLLRAFPREYMSEDCRQLLDAETRAFPDLSDRDTWFSGVRVVGSPMSPEQMANAKDEHILNLFEELTDDHGWDHPQSWGRGGPIQAGRAGIERPGARRPDCSTATTSPKRVSGKPSVGRLGEGRLRSRITLHFDLRT